jgi:uncharacterized membrane protein YphA (DoxX/SURF4 family)
MLRLAIGYHFFKEGTTKLRHGDFTAEYFLRDAKGPLAPSFQKLLRDADGRERLCIEETTNAVGERQFQFNTDLTFALWDDFIDRAAQYYRFNDEALESQIIARRENLALQIKQARTSQDASVDTSLLEQQRAKGEQDILTIRSQLGSAEKILASHKAQLVQWLESNRAEIFSHYASAERLDGFVYDGENREKVATFVESLRGQVDEIRQTRTQQLAGWKSEIDAIWNSFETEINNLAVDKQAEKEPVRLHRPFDQEFSNLKLINRIIPWFDTIVGILLILGLFTRLASLAGAGFLASVIATQPPWIPGTTPTYYQAIEMFALLVIFATCAGRLGGLDYFLSRKRPRRDQISED